MGLPANYSDGGKMKRLAAGIEELDREAAALNEEWELVAAETCLDIILFANVDISPLAGLYYFHN